LLLHPDGDEDVIFYNDINKLQSKLESELQGFAVVEEFW
jgi:hypothetical protein